MRLIRVSLIASLFALLLLSACAGLPVRGSVGMQAIETRVDSEAARYYLEHYLPGNRMDTDSMSASIAFTRTPMAPARSRRAQTIER